jgi:prepilin-type N-terminal cleavage/methylation domain-containing protein
MKKLQKGFTLLEILVVVGIIAIVSAVGLAALSSAKNKGDNAAIRSNLNEIRTQSEMYHLGAKRYGYNASDVTDCTTVTTFIASTTGQGAGSKIVADLIKNARGAGNVRCVVPANGSTWAVSTSLIGGGYACVYSGDQSIIASTTGTLVDSISNNACVR